MSGRIFVGLVMTMALVAGTAAAQTAPAAQATPALASPEAPAELRASRTTYDVLMDVLKDERPRATDAQIERLKELPLEAIWGALQREGYQRSFVTGFELTQPGTKMVGRALTMRYLPVRPDLMEAVQTLAAEGDWDHQYNVRAGEDAEPGDIILVELGGAVNRATFVGDVTGIGMAMAGVEGIVIDGGLRDLQEFLPLKDLPVYYKGAHASAMADQVGVGWNVPIRLGDITVMPGDVIIGDASGLLVVPPQLVDQAIAAAEDTVHSENFKREMMRTKKYRARDIYPRLSPELEQLYEAWAEKHPKKGVRPN